MGLNKKGVFFSLTALLVVGLLYISLSTQPVQKPQEAARLRVQKVIETHDAVLETILPHLLRQQSIIVLESIAQQQFQTGFAAYGNVDHLRNEFQDCVEDHTGDCLLDPGGYPWLITYPDNAFPVGTDIDSLEDLITDLEQQYAELEFEVDLTLTPGSIVMQQVSPWELLVEAEFSIDLSDTQNLGGNYLSTRQISTLVPLEGLTDPFSLRELGEQRFITRGELGEERINPSDIAEWTPELLIEHAAEGQYVYDSKAPSYLQRLVNDNSPSTFFGIRSLLPPNNFDAAGQSVDYFRGTVTCYYEIVFGPDRVRLTPEFLVSEYYVAEYYDAGYITQNNCDT